MSGGGSGSGSNTTQTVQEVPAYIQAESQANQQLANSLASSPYPVYQGSMIQPMTDLQNSAIASVPGAAQAYQPYTAAATNVLNQANPTGAINPMMQGGMQSLGPGGAISAFGNAQSLTDPNAVSSYMSPYIQASLQPQLSDLMLQNAGQQQQINQQSTQAGAFGDARQGAAQGLQNYYTNQAVNQLTGQAYQNAFTAANQALGQAQQTQLGAGQGFNQTANAYGNLAQQALQGQQGLMNQAQLYNTLGTSAQNLGLTGANAMYQAGQQQQTQLQSELNNSYQQYLNQVNWPYQMLNVREAALANTPYNISTATTLPTANTTAQGFGTIAGLAGLAGQGTGGSPKIPT